MTETMTENYMGDEAQTVQLDEDERQFLVDLYEVAKAPAGQRTLMRILERLGTFEPAWRPNNAQMAKNTVLRDFGQELMDDLAVANPEAHDALQISIRVRRKAGATYDIFGTDN